VFILPCLVPGRFGWPTADDADAGYDSDSAEGGANGGSAAADEDGYEADSEEEAARIKKGFRFNWAAYRAAFGDTPVHLGFTAMFAEYAKLFARIAHQTTSSVSPPMTVSERISIGEQATAFVNNFVTPILGTVNSTKAHKLFCHLTDAVRWHGNLQNANTAANESEYKGYKPFYAGTSKSIATLTRQLVRHAHGARAIKRRIAEADNECVKAHQEHLFDLAVTGRHGGAAAAASAPPALRHRATTPLDRSAAVSRGADTPFHRANVRIDALASRPGLANIFGVLNIQDSDQVRVTQTLDFNARFNCGSRIPQRLRATTNDRGSSWLNRVLFYPPSKPNDRRIGQVHAIVRRADGDHAVLCLMRPTAKDNKCPLQSRGCTRLQWHVAARATDVSVLSVPVANTLRIVHVVPDFAELAARTNLHTAPASLDAPVEERLAIASLSMHFL